jgi:hypothetical protein
MRDLPGCDMRVDQPIAATPSANLPMAVLGMPIALPLPAFIWTAFVGFCP